MQEFRDGKQELILTTLTTESLSLDEKQKWHSIRKELEDVEISVAAFDAQS
jgi:hypothetical protein